MKKIGIIGVGHLGSAILKGLIKSQYVPSKQIYISGGTSNKATKLAEQFSCQFCSSNKELTKQSDILIFAVIPKILPQILNKIKSALRPDTIVVSTAASFTFDDFYQFLPESTPLARAIPNLPVAICQGMTAISASNNINREQLEQVNQLFLALGKIASVNENKLDISSTIAGCSPAYVALFIEALADAGVFAGLSREESYLMSKQAVLGAAATLLESNMLPAELKDGVCSPGGTTIRGVAKLEQFGLRNAVIEAVKASAKIKD